MFVELKAVSNYNSQSCFYAFRIKNFVLASPLTLKPLLIVALNVRELNWIAALDEVKTALSSLVPIYHNTWLHMSMFVVLLFLPQNALLVLIRLVDVATSWKIWSLKSLRCRTKGQWKPIITVSAVTTNTLDNAHHNTGAMNQMLWQTTGGGVWNGRLELQYRIHRTYCLA
jgi:hypothetical protein